MCLSAAAAECSRGVCRVQKKLGAGAEQAGRLVGCLVLLSLVVLL